ncbi:MAG: hypothetical protein OXH06_06370 [Gemmatimonadetes bacterium]|nr:hypothetical protein [Gemmatimonadota bacterium]
MSWILELALALCLLMVAGGYSVYLMTPGNKKPSGSTVGIFLAVAAVGLAIWAFTSERWNLLPDADDNPALTLSDKTAGLPGESLRLFLENQRRLESTVVKLEDVADRLELAQSGTGLGIAMEIGIGICLIIFAGGLVSYIHLRKKREGKGMSPERAKRMESRLDAVDQRLNDLQEVIITMDERLRRDKTSV